MATLPDLRSLVTLASILLLDPILPYSLLVVLTMLPSIGSLLPISSDLQRWPQTRPGLLVTTPPSPW